MHKTGLEEDKDRRRNHVSDLMDQDDWLEDRKLPPANATWPTCLIIAPSTVALNWQREFETWGYFEVGLYTGSRKSRQPVLEDFKKGRLDVVITSFELAMRDIDLLSDLAWSAIIIDEVHRVKNETAKSTKAYHKFSCLRRFGLTGTAIQNSYDEFHAILHWTNPGRFEKKKDWRAKVSGPLAAGQSSTATDEQRAKGLEIAMELKCKILPGYFLRRTKDLIKHQLPKKNDQVVFCPLTPIQIKLYKVILKLPLVQALIHKDDPCECGREPEKPTRKCCYDYKTILQPALFRYIWALIKLSNHVALILPHPDDNPEQQKRNRQLTAEAFPDTEAPTYGPTILQSRYCGKWDVLAKLLSKWREDPTNKVLIFTKSVKLLDMLEFHVKQLGYGYKRLDGKVKQDDRMGIIDEFNFNPETFVFLISTLAGGTGLNLTGANKVVIFDPNWNPAHDLQAMDRAFRIGQKRDVDVYRLLGAGSIEELVYACQVYKQQQMAIGYDASIQTRYFEAVKGDTSKKGELFGIKNIFRLHEGPLVTKMAIEKANIAQFEWGLANMKGGGKSGTSAKTDVDGGEKEEDLHGIEDLLFNEGPVPQLEVEEGEIQKLLSEAGIMYSHRNDHILQPSRIEEQRAKVTLEKTRKRKRESNKKRSESSEEEEAKPQWPPIRKHKQSVLDPAQQLADRRAALLEIGFINTMAQFHDFGKRFASETRAEQDRILKELDDYSANKQAAATADSDVDMSD
ncbi:P-loop containing nucleoside triphosphate hydrolase protein [Mycena floridula]|nr:P-loop containing nucleoside triphosphate hydrolase protein [Mycena floridula]